VNAEYVETTITYLVLRKRPSSLPPLPAAPRLALMRAEDIPLDFYRYLYAAVGGSCLWIERLNLTDAQLSKRIHRHGIEVFVLYANGSPAGYYELDFADPLRTRLVYFGLMPRWVGHGLGAWFLGSAVAEAFARGAAETIVNTCTLDHPAALPLYQRLGFEPIRRESRRLRIPPGLQIPGHIAAGIRPESGTGGSL
jgi:GNAT superfamily N-acetyltransferase